MKTMPMVAGILAGAVVATLAGTTIATRHKEHAWEARLDAQIRASAEKACRKNFTYAKENPDPRNPVVPIEQCMAEQEREGKKQWGPLSLGDRVAAKAKLVEELEDLERLNRRLEEEALSATKDRCEATARFIEQVTGSIAASKFRLKCSIDPELANKEYEKSPEYRSVRAAEAKAGKDVEKTKKEMQKYR